MTNSYFTGTRQLDRPAEAGLPAEADSRQTRQIYDWVAPLYTVSARLFHSQAHNAALSTAAIQNGARTLEVAMGSGEMFQRLIGANPDGITMGVDLSPKMAAQSQSRARKLFPKASAHCQSADARSLPFPAGYFDAVVCCYLFELLPESQAGSAMAELVRVLQPGGQLTVVLVAQNERAFNALYRIGGKLAPAFWGRQVERHVSSLLTSHGFAITRDRYIRQLFFRSRILSARSEGK